MQDCEVGNVEVSFDQENGTAAVIHDDGVALADVNPYEVHQKNDDEAASVGDKDEVLPIHVADEHGDLARYPGDKTDNLLTTCPSTDSSEVKKAEKSAHSVLGAGMESVKYFYSSVLLLFSVVVVMTTIFTNQTVGTAQKGVPPFAAFGIFWFLILWLALMEGGQGALVGLQPIDKSLYSNSHPRAYKTAMLAHKGDNLERFIVGRQFLVVLVVFVMNMMASAIPKASVLGLAGALQDIFVTSGVALILVAIMLGQLTAQVNAAKCMLDFINNYLMLFTTHLSLAIEMSGLLHAVYLVQIAFAKISGTPIESNESPRTTAQKIFFWGRNLVSLVVLGFSLAVTLKALFDGNTAMWKGVPDYASVIIFFILNCFVGLMEGMQIALFAIVNLPEEELKQHTVAYRNCQLTFRDQNLQAFLIGRQICVTICMFIVARITSLTVVIGEDNIFGVSDGLQGFFNTGLLGALITTIIGSLIWRIVAASFPVAFLTNPLIYLTIRLCLLLEMSGVCSAAWVLARYHKPLVNLQPDEVHLEGAEPHTAEPVTRRDKDIDRAVTVVKFIASLTLLVFAVVMVVAAIFQRQTMSTATKGAPPLAVFFIFWILIAWLAMLEGGQGALLGLQPIDKDRYAESHPKTVKNTALAHKGDNMNRFIVGRQFLVVIIIFVSGMLMSSVESPTILGMSGIVTTVFLEAGVAVILVIIMIGQLTAQVNAANCMLDFMNSYLMLFTTYVSLGVELSGLLHATYLVQIIFSKASGKNIKSNETPPSLLQSIFFWCRVILSFAILAFALAVTLKALIDGKTTMWKGVPEYASVIIFFVLVCFVGLLEGIQIALFAVANLPEEELKQHKIAHANCGLVFFGQNLQAFLIGRQICVTICMFVIAHITTVNVGVGEGNIFSVSDSVQEFFNTGLLAALITTIIASLMWRIIALSFPLAFMSNPLIYLIIHFCKLLDMSGVCSAAWVLGRWFKVLFSYQPDEVYLEGAERHTKVPVTRRDKDIDVTVTVIKFLYSTALLIFSIIVVMATIFSANTKLSSQVHPILAFVVIWALTLWLAMIEGGQGCLVGLKSVDKELYSESHPTTLKSTELAHKGDNMERFIVGRQFLVVLVVFVVNLSGSALTGTEVLNLVNPWREIFVQSGVAMILMTVIVGQLTAQVNAANCMLDFIDTHFMFFTTLVSLAIEFSGLLHCVYLVQLIFSKIAGNPIKSNEPARSVIQNLFFWGRVMMSLAALCFAFAVTLKALFDGNTTAWESVPESVSVIVFFVLMCFVGLMEGIQIALFAVVNLPEEELLNHSMAYKTCQLTFQGNNLQAFLIGRQIFVTICMFVIARITTLNVLVGDNNIFGVSDGLQVFFNTGLLGALITTIVASLAWRIIASSFPVAFLSNPLVYLIIHLCLVLEATGVCSAAWLLALIHRAFAGYQVDEVYIGTTEERLEKKRDKDKGLSASDKV